MISQQMRYAASNVPNGGGLKRNRNEEQPYGSKLGEEESHGNSLINALDKFVITPSESFPTAPMTTSEALAVFTKTTLLGQFLSTDLLGTDGTLYGSMNSGVFLFWPDGEGMQTKRYWECTTTLNLNWTTATSSAAGYLSASLFNWASVGGTALAALANFTTANPTITQHCSILLPVIQFNGTPDDVSIEPQPGLTLDVDATANGSNFAPQTYLGRIIGGQVDLFSTYTLNTTMTPVSGTFGAGTMSCCRGICNWDANSLSALSFKKDLITAVSTTVGVQLRAFPDISSSLLPQAPTGISYVTGNQCTVSFDTFGTRLLTNYPQIGQIPTNSVCVSPFLSINGYTPSFPGATTMTNVTVCPTSPLSAPSISCTATIQSVTPAITPSNDFIQNFLATVVAVHVFGNVKYGNVVPVPANCTHTTIQTSLQIESAQVTINALAVSGLSSLIYSSSKVEFRPKLPDTSSVWIATILYIQPSILTNYTISSSYSLTPVFNSLSYAEQNGLSSTSSGRVKWATWNQVGNMQLVNAVGMLVQQANTGPQLSQYMLDGNNIPLAAPAQSVGRRINQINSTFGFPQFKRVVNLLQASKRQSELFKMLQNSYNNPPMCDSDYKDLEAEE